MPFPPFICALSLVVVAVPGAAFADHPIGVFGPVTGGPVVVPTADVLPKGKWALSTFSEFRSFEEIGNADLEAQAVEEGHVHALDHLWSQSLSASYGITDDFTLSLSLPYVERADIREAHVHGGHVHGGHGSVHRAGDSRGLGDLTLSGYWRLWENASGAAASLTVGTFAPTGETHEESVEDNRLGTEFQPGSSAWRPFASLVYSRNFDGYALHSHLRYTSATEGAQDTELGDKVDYGFALSYRLSAPAEEPAPHVHEPGAGAHHHDESTLQWDAMLELTGEYTDGQTVAGVEEDDFEHLLYLAPGIRLSGAEGWTTALSLGVPVYEHRKKGHIETDWRVVFSASVGL